MKCGLCVERQELYLLRYRALPAFHHSYREKALTETQGFSLRMTAFPFVQVNQKWRRSQATLVSICSAAAPAEAKGADFFPVSCSTVGVLVGKHYVATGMRPTALFKNFQKKPKRFIWLQKLNNFLFILLCILNFFTLTIQLTVLFNSSTIVELISAQLC